MEERDNAGHSRRERRYIKRGGADGFGEAGCGDRPWERPVGATLIRIGTEGNVPAGIE